MFYNYICYTEKNEYVPNFFKSIFSNNWRGQQSVCGGYVCSGYGLNLFFFCIFLCSTTNDKTECKNLQGRGTVLNFLNNSV